MLEIVQNASTVAGIIEDGAKKRTGLTGAKLARQAAKDEELAPYIEAALARRQSRPPMTDSEIPIVPASRPKPQAAG